MSEDEMTAKNYWRDFDPANATILFTWWAEEGLTPETLEETYADMRGFYKAWLDKTGLTPTPK